MSPKIVIIGAGPAGLTLGRILHVNSIPFIIYDLAASSTSSPQGGTLDLHAQTGQLALKEAGLFSQFEAASRTEGEDMIISSRDGVRHVEVLDTDRGRPEIDREFLRKMLLDSFPAENIKWNHKLLSCTATTATFANGHLEKDIDLLVGADGAWSKVRPLMTYVPPFYSGISCVEFRHYDADMKHPQVAKTIGKGNHFVFGESTRKCLLSQRMGDGSLRTYAAIHKPEHWLKECGIDWSNTNAAKKQLLEEYDDFAPEFKKMIEDAEEDSMPTRPLYMLPVGLSWPSHRSATLIGDSAHLMTPFAGEGVNAAMRDAYELALAIKESKEDVAAAVKMYESSMFPRMTQVTTKTWNSLMLRFREGGIANMKKRVEKSMTQKG
ncbi:putative zeaxanthin epoxidase [Aulographum hederae CBS 113979]|uniref:Putative zeaxanthin epoxidase n=1 Tax=Aulographum hederae CBS 113979 TaxID=1176131 RepID=A0A6G1GLE4_9PEZI|nr:putative zeaxanthin epoxidase [Aulographum hederae CBS 113979]